MPFEMNRSWNNKDRFNNKEQDIYADGLQVV